MLLRRKAEQKRTERRRTDCAAAGHRPHRSNHFQRRSLRCQQPMTPSRIASRKCCASRSMSITSSFIALSSCWSSWTKSMCDEPVAHESITSTSGVVATTSRTDASDSELEPTTTMSFSLARILDKASRTSRFWANRYTAARISSFMHDPNTPEKTLDSAAALRWRTPREGELAGGFPSTEFIEILSEQLTSCTSAWLQRHLYFVATIQCLRWTAIVLRRRPN